MLEIISEMNRMEELYKKATMEVQRDSYSQYIIKLIDNSNLNKYHKTYLYNIWDERIFKINWENPNRWCGWNEKRERWDNKK